MSDPSDSATAAVPSRKKASWTRLVSSESIARGCPSLVPTTAWPSIKMETFRADYPGRQYYESVFAAFDLIRDWICRSLVLKQV